MMLNTDVELAYDIDVDNVIGTSCTINEDCTIADTHAQVLEYASVKYHNLQLNFILLFPFKIFYIRCPFESYK